MATFCIVVSIPNGMEFYFIGVFAVLSIVVSFNSQRDGILQICENQRRNDQVSIPNGMEFYMRWLSVASCNDSFNSQRDGILLYIWIKINSIKPFQFPTGWNSTQAIFFGLPALLVSIPNGMEFYVLLNFKNLRLSRVSIPNGMEFYRRQRGHWYRGGTFQFPTGWNSTHT